MIEAYPLCWPNGYKRNNKQIFSRFKTHTLKVCRDLLKIQVRLLKGENLIISTNMMTRNDGEVYSNAKEPDDSGVAVYFKRYDAFICLVCDKYKKVWENIYAIANTIKAMRDIDRWGVSDMLDRMFTGFIAITEDAGKNWPEILKVSSEATIYEIQKAFKKRLKEVHPDVGGTTEEFLLVQNAYKSAISQFS
jgi:hypothetical protein